MNTKTHQNAFARAVQNMGGVSEASKLLGFAFPSYVSNALGRGRCPSHWVLRIEALSGVSRHELRPDIFGVAPSEPMKQAA